jgi:hypothetical protein
VDAAAAHDVGSSTIIMERRNHNNMADQDNVQDFSCLRGQMGVSMRRFTDQEIALKIISFL